MTLNASLNIAKMAIQNNEFALNVISNNVANMNTPGYCRQSVAFQSRAGYETYNYASSRNFNIGDGAEIAGIIRNRDQFLDNSYRSQSADTGFYTQIGSMTSIIESTMNELGEKGLQSVLNQFFEAAEATKVTESPTHLRSRALQISSTRCPPACKPQSRRMWAKSATQQVLPVQKLKPQLTI